MHIQLWVWDDVSGRELIINNASCVPPIATTMDTPWGMREVYAQHYDFNPATGDARVHLKVQLPR